MTKIYKYQMICSELPEYSEVVRLLDPDHDVFVRNIDDLLTEEYLDLVGVKVYDFSGRKLMIEILYGCDNSGKKIVPRSGFPDSNNYILR